MHSANDVRHAFLDYYETQGHTILASGPLVPQSDPSLMFTNAGMVQFKNVFTGIESREYVRAATSQKCVRAGGKHNDLDNVGYTLRHHTFFEMLGNFSFGDYFKDVAIELAWALITKEFELDPARLCVTVYHDDTEAYELWKKIGGLPEERIIRIDTADNFWSMGDIGPCGPCSEIFFDNGDHLSGGPPGSPDQDGDRYVEIWNLVFMQYEQRDTGQRVALPMPSIDTGMGLERITAVMQGKHDNYDTDLFRDLIIASSEMSDTRPDGDHAVSHRVIADHIRAISFLMADGVMPSNEGRGYVLRRIMRRAMRHAHLLGTRDPLLWQLIPTVVHKMGSVYVELGRAEPLMTEVLKLEESRFREMLDRGLKLLEQEVTNLKVNESLPGEVAFSLYDTYGFPIDLTQDAMRARGLDVDIGGFELAMARQRAEARASWVGTGDKSTETFWYEIREGVGPTEFLGHETTNAEGRIAAIVSDGNKLDVIYEGTEAFFIVNQTPFYAEAGGQIGDAGTFTATNDVNIKVHSTTRKLDNLYLHHGTVMRGSIEVGAAVEMRVEKERRAGIEAHHSATHLLNAALRNNLGDHVTQKGSLVEPDRLRFDFSHPRAISLDEMELVETEVNRLIRCNTVVTTQLMDLETARESGALALFGEKYGNEVRVLTMSDAAGDSYSTELCGGTHADRTGDLGIFKIVEEGSISSGIRRIEALVGDAALRYIAERDRLLRHAAEVLKSPVTEIADRAISLVNERRQLERLLIDARSEAVGSGLGLEIQQIGDIPFAKKLLTNVPAKDLKGMVDRLKGDRPGVHALISVMEDKASLVIGITPEYTDRLSAIRLVRAAVISLGGKGGGGRPDMAQGGGPNGDKVEEAFQVIEEAIAEVWRDKTN